MCVVSLRPFHFVDGIRSVSSRPRACSDLSSQKRRAHDKEEKRLKQEEAKTAADLKAAEAPKVEAPKVEKVEAKVEIPAAAPQEKKEKL